MKKILVAALLGAALGVTGMMAGGAWLYVRGSAPPSAVALEQPLREFSVDPSWVLAGRPRFWNTETVHSPDGKVIGGMWACDGPAEFEWTFHMDETVHLIEGKVEVNYLGNRFTLLPGTTATFYAGTKAVWYVPEHARKGYVLHGAGRLVRFWRWVAGMMGDHAANGRL
ncbi:MAG: hypothetical protein JWQ72_253 [Polaromonas sp.]|nr:hypothetical protein [Polaromonas sp.]